MFTYEACASCGCVKATPRSLHFEIRLTHIAGLLGLNFADCFCWRGIDFGCFRDSRNGLAGCGGPISGQMTVMQQLCTMHKGIGTDVEQHIHKSRFPDGGLRHDVWAYRPCTQILRVKPPSKYEMAPV